MSHALTMDGMGLEGLIEKRERPTPKTRKAPKTARRAQPKARAQRNTGPAARAAKNTAKNANDLALATALTGGERGAWNHFVRQFAGVVYAAVQRRLHVDPGRGARGRVNARDAGPVEADHVVAR